MATFIETRDIPVENLTPHPSNPNRGDVKELAKSLKEFGQFRSIVALPTGVILAGHHVVEAAKSLGMDTVRVDVVDADEQEALKIMLADNRLADLGLGPDLDLLLDALNAVDDLAGTGYDSEYLQMLTEATAGPPALDDLADEAGPAPEDEFYRRLTLTLDPVVVTRWEEFRKGYPDDNTAMLFLMDGDLADDEEEEAGVEVSA